MRLSNRAAFGWIETPAPISLRASACSNTATSRPRARSASAAVKPPIPPPTIAMRSELGISRTLAVSRNHEPCEASERLRSRVSAGYLGRRATIGIGLGWRTQAGARSDANRTYRQGDGRSWTGQKSRKAPEIFRNSAERWLGKVGSGGVDG